MAVIGITVSVDGKDVPVSEIPDAAVPAIQLAYGGTAEDAVKQFVAEFMASVEARALEARVNAARATALTTVQEAEQKARDDFATKEWVKDDLAIK